MIKYNTDSITNYNKEIMRNIKVELKIIETKNNIEIMWDNLDSCFNFPKDTLGETILIDDAVCSKLISELVNKSWLPLKILYPLAEMIERNYPNEDINWLAQFHNIELVMLKYKKFRKEFPFRKENITYSEFRNSPFIYLIKLTEEDVNEIMDTLINKFEPWGIHERILNR